MSNTEMANYINQLGESVQGFMAKYDDKLNALERHLALQDAPGGGFSSPRSEFSGLGDFCRAVALAQRPGGQMDARLAKVQAASGANEGIPSDGGFLVEKTLMEPLLGATFETGLLAKRCFRIPVGGNSNGLKIPAIDEKSRVNGSRFGGAQSYWAAEAGTVTASKPKFREIVLQLHKLFALSYVTDELLQDSAALGRVLQQSFLDEFAFKIDDAILNGTGAGMPLGILNSDCLVSVAKESAQQASTLVYENVLKMYSRLLPRSRKTACWLINQSVEPQLFSMSLTVGTGGVPVYLPATGAAGQPFASLLGLPVIPVEQCQALGSKGDIILADLSSYILADKGGIQAAQSAHVMFIYDEMTFRWTYRLDGSPLYNSPIVPFKGSASLSPFVTLDERA